MAWFPPTQLGTPPVYIVKTHNRPRGSSNGLRLVLNDYSFAKTPSAPPWKCHFVLFSFVLPAWTAWKVYRSSSPSFPPEVSTVYTAEKKVRRGWCAPDSPNILHMYSTLNRYPPFIKCADLKTMHHEVTKTLNSLIRSRRYSCRNHYCPILLPGVRLAFWGEQILQLT